MDSKLVKNEKKKKFYPFFYLINKIKKKRLVWFMGVWQLVKKKKNKNYLMIFIFQYKIKI